MIARGQPARRAHNFHACFVCLASTTCDVAKRNSLERKQEYLQCCVLRCNLLIALKWTRGRSHGDQPTADCRPALDAVSRPREPGIHRARVRYVLLRHQHCIPDALCRAPLANRACSTPCRCAGCLSGLVGYLSYPDNNVVFTAAKAIWHLSSGSSNRNAVKDHPGLFAKLVRWPCVCTPA